MRIRGHSTCGKCVILARVEYTWLPNRRGDKDVGPAADIYALGAILYECLTGRPPFLGANAVQTMAQVCNLEPVPPRQLQPDVPRDAETICLKCLQKDAGKRYPSAEALASDLGRYLQGKAIGARPVGAVERATKWVRRNPVVTGLLAAVLLSLTAGAIIGYANYRQAKRQEGIAVEKADLAIKETARADSETAEAKRQEGIAVDKADLALKEAKRADDQTVKVKVQLKETSRVLDLSKLREANVAYESNMVETARDTLAEIAPENRCIAWGILSRRFEGGLFTLCGHTNLVTSVAFSGDGRRIVTTDVSGKSLLWDMKTGQNLLDEPIPLIDPARNRTPDGRFQFLPSGNRVLKVPTRIEEEECLRRTWLNRPDPDWHVTLQEELVAAGNVYGAAVHRSFEQQARGLLAAEGCDFSRAYAHFLAAVLLMPKPPETPLRPCLAS